MFIEAQKLIGLAIAGQDTQSKIGEIADILVDPENGNFLGFLVNTGGILGSQKVLSNTDILDWDPNGIVTTSVENLVMPQEIVRLQNIINQKIFLLGMKAKTESGESLGIVENLLIDTDAQIITKYYLKDIFGKERIFMSDNVVRIDKCIYFTDDVLEPPADPVSTVA